jgi:hypothetical protein
MNIFALDADPAKAAQMHADVHVVKMILETAQLLSTAWHELHSGYTLPLDSPNVLAGLARVTAPSVRPSAPPDPVEADGALHAGAKPSTIWLLGGQRIYAPTHSDHPCAVWVRAGRANYAWLWMLGMSLCDEYTYRYTKEHATLKVLRALELVPPNCAGGNLTPFAQCMPEQYRQNSATQAYRNYYRTDKSALLSYTKRAPPDWL